MSETNNEIGVAGFELGHFATNCYVVTVGDGPGCWIVDAGIGPGALIEHVRESSLSPEKLLLTHAHADHMGGLDEVRRAFPGLEVWLHPAEHAWLDDPVLNLSGAHGMPVTAREAEHELNEGDVLTLGGVAWDVLHTPGHSPGSVSIVARDAGVALVGDTLFNGSIGRSDFPTSDEAALHAAIREKLYSLPDETVALPGHGPATTIGREKVSNPFVRA